MFSIHQRSFALAALLALAACAPTPVSEETERSTAQGSVPPPPASEDLGEIIVTGSRARSDAFFSRNVSMSLPSRMDLPRPVDRENYGKVDANPVHRVSEHPVSTFSIDVDTGSYSNVRRMLNAGRLPPQDAVRVEEMINYFDYGYPAPRDARDAVPRHHRARAARRGTRSTQLLQVGIQGYEVPRPSIPAANLVFLIDVSGSMQTSRTSCRCSSMRFALLARQLRAAGPRLDRRLCRQRRRGAGADAGRPSKATIRRGARPAGGRRLDQRRRGHRSSPTRWPQQAFIDRRHQPRRARHRRRLQRRHRRPSRRSRRPGRATSARAASR